MSYTNENRSKNTRPARLTYAEALDRLSKEKANKQQRRKTRYNWS